MKILRVGQTSEKQIIDEAVKVLKNGGIIVYPTETCYGIGTDATNEVAVSRLLNYKTRREGKPISVVMANKEMAREYVDLNDMAENLYDNYLPGPITIVSRSLGKVVLGVESEYGTVGVRVPDFELVVKISEAFKKPFTATSANMSYKPRPYSVDALLNDLPEKKKELIDLIIDAGELPQNEASTVVDTTLNTLNVLREGKLKFENSILDDKQVLSAHTYSDEETINFGSVVMLKYIDSILDNCLVLMLSGQLGTGKTQFAKGVAKQLKIHKLIKSPTYTILSEYKYELGKRKGHLAHIDTWKVFDWKELMRVGLETYTKEHNVLVVEWGDKFFQDLEQFFKKKNAKIVKVQFDYLNESERLIKVYE